MADENKFDTSGSKQPNTDSGNAAIDIGMIDQFVLLEQAFNGTDGFKNGRYLIPHHRELFYDRRRQYSPYVNYFKTIVEAMYEPVFTKDFMRDHKNEIFAKFEKNTGGVQVSLTKFIKLCLKYVRLHSTVFIVVDNRKQTTESQEEALKNDDYPYAYIKKAYELNMDGVAFDNRGKLLSIMFFDHSETTCNSNDSVDFYRYWDFNKTILYKQDKNFKDSSCEDFSKGTKNFSKKYTLAEEFSHNLGEIPIFIAYEELPDTPINIIPEPNRYDLMRVNHTIFNQDSEGRNLERDQGFSIFIKPENPGEENDINIGTNNYIGFPPDSRHAPGFVSPDSKILQALLEKRMSMQEALIAIADQSGVQGITKSKNAKSGLAYAFEFFAYESTLITSAKIAAEIELNIVRLFNLWTNEKVEYSIDYPKSFKPNQTAELFTTQNEVLDLMDVPKVFKDKVWLEKFKLMYPDDIKGLAELEKQLIEVKPLEMDVDIIDINEDEDK